MADSVSIDRSAWLWSWNTGRISALEVGLLAWFLFCVHLTARFNYLLFHCTAELFSIFVAVTIFLITINIWRLITNQYFLFIGIAYGFVAGLDTLHTLAFKGMGVFTAYDYYAPQLWIAARYLESISMATAFLLLGRNKRLHAQWLIGGFSVVAAALVASIFLFRIFPICFVAGRGLTPFKIVSEYVICGFYVLSLGLLKRNRRYFESPVYRLLRMSLLAMIAMELCFTLYHADAMSDLFNQAGHLFKILAFYLVYKTVVFTGLHDPIHLLSRELDAGKRELQAKRMLGSIVENIPLMIFIKRAKDLRFELVNRAGEELIGLSREQLIGRNDSDFFPREQADFFTAMDREVLDGQSVVDIPVESVRTASGEERLLHTRKVPLLDEDGKPAFLLGISLDITEQKRAEREIKSSEERFFKAFHLAPVLSSLSRLEDGTILDVNDRYCQVLGYSREEICGCRTTDFGVMRGEDRTNLLSRFGTQTRLSNLDLTVYSKLGEPVPCLYCGEIIRVNDEPHLLSMMVDMTARKAEEEARRRLEQQVAQTQKLDSLGSLAGGVAHDMNNILAAIQAVVQTLQIQRGADPDLAGYLDTIEQAATRGRDLVKGLTNFARKDINEPERLDLNSLVRTEMALLRRTTLQKVELVMDLDEALPAILGERGTLGSALMNLCVNAVDAMPKGGTRTRPGGMVELEVQDTGQGMAPEVRARAMEPFFTTKPLGQGTGLGLASVYVTAKTHGGSVAVQSEPGLGTSVCLRLPATDLEARPQITATPSQPLAGPLDILLVDDDELVRGAVPMMVELFGHHVTALPGGQEALHWLAAAPPVDLVILDLNMPAMDGTETLKRIRQTHPELPVILATGHLDSATAQLLKGDRRLLSLSKPFTMDDLNSRMNELMSRG